MSFIGNLLGLNSNQVAPQLAQTQSPISSAQAQLATTGAGNELQYQQNLANALAGQNGLANQSNTFAQQQALANQLQSESQGQGPNPALAQLNQTTAANTQNQAALMAGQRGASQNAGLIARQAAQQGAANQQNAIGQAATLRANQQLAAQQQLAGQQQAMQGVAANQIGNQINQQNTTANAFQNQQNALLGQINAQNQAAIANQQQASGAQNTQNQQGMNLLGSVASGAGSLLSLAEGGQVSDKQPSVVDYFKKIKMAKGGQVPALVSPGEAYLPPSKVKEAMKGRDALSVAERIPGKPKYPGNNYANDTVKKTLKSGGIVIPNSIMQSDNPKANANKFIAAILAKQHLKSKKK